MSKNRAQSSNVVQRPVKTKAERPDWNVRRVEILGSSVLIELGKDSLAEYPGVTIAAVLEKHGLDFRKAGVGKPFSKICESTDQPANILICLAEIFPNIEQIIVSRRLSSRDGGGHAPWTIWKIDWNHDNGGWILTPSMA